MRERRSKGVIDGVREGVSEGGRESVRVRE